jgi:hypothetical protein
MSCSRSGIAIALAATCLIGARAHAAYTRFCVAGDLHCVNSFYTWPDAHGSLVANLDGFAADATSVIGSFAGHSDWRLPPVVELQTIVALDAPTCGADGACIDPIFGATAYAEFYASYWTSSRSAAAPEVGAWCVNFDDGAVFELSQSTSNNVRAVRTVL